MSTTTVTAPGQPAAKQKPVKDTSKSGINPIGKVIIYIVLIALTCIFLGPILFVLMNSFKSKFELSNNPFALPMGDTFVGLENYVTGLQLSNFFSSILWSFVITIGSVDRKSVV